MPSISTFVECDVPNSFRVQQIAGMFDIPWKARARESFTAELPGLDEDWTIGAIVGPSGSGKTTLARHAYGDAVWRPGQWPEDRAVIDGFGDLPILVPGVQRIAESVRDMTRDAEELPLHLAGGALMIPGAADVLAKYLERTVMSYPHALLITPVGIARSAA